MELLQKFEKQFGYTYDFGAIIFQNKKPLKNKYNKIMKSK
jgi:hypothetical protein